MKPGDTVNVVHKGAVLFSGILESLDDDGDTYQVNVEWWAKIKLVDGSTRLLRQSAYGDMEPSRAGWAAQAKSLNKYGHKLAIVQGKKP